ncbi:MAG: adenylate/guanylate cyclase domain-containing protein [Rhizobiaceae bacterium]|nr:adenylate/guanylate cyclase domain-containing protein [Rhizobiaceae bacterium]
MRAFSFPWSRDKPRSSNQINQIKPGQGSVTQRLRLYSGLVLVVFVLFHYVNHALGNISLEVMIEVQEWRQALWQSIPGTIVLYGALTIHISLVIWKLVLRKNLRLPLWEWAQISLGLLIPYFLLTHIIAMRGTAQRLGLDVDYDLALGMMWPGAALAQSFLLLVVWLHGCIGMHFWLRTRPWYTRNFGWIASFSSLLPALALTGWINAARHNAANILTMQISDPAEAARYGDTLKLIYSEMFPLFELGRTIVLSLGAALILAMVLHQISLLFKKRIKIDYGDGRIITSTPGHTILEISRNAGIPHMSVCGGRARCSTCRTLIIEGGKNMQDKTKAETILLDRLDAEDSVRLACQAIVSGNVTLRPMLKPQDQISAPDAADPLGWGVERKIAIMFLDIRGFSRISEKRLPYDVVFILNSFFAEVATAVEANNGYIDKFMGDGMMALFGLATGEVEAARDAIKAAIDCEKAAITVSQILSQHLNESIKIGIGIHVGDAVVGRIGKTSDQNSPSRLTAIGDSVNVSARLEQATKEFGVAVVISEETATLAGLQNTEQFGEKTEISVRNISRPVNILAIRNLDKLGEALQ